MLVFIKKSFC